MAPNIFSTSGESVDSRFPCPESIVNGPLDLIVISRNVSAFSPPDRTTRNAHALSPLGKSTGGGSGLADDDAFWPSPNAEKTRRSKVLEITVYRIVVRETS
jgi:hypothetical protein